MTDKDLTISSSTDLTTLTPVAALTLFSTAQGLDPIIDAIEKEARAVGSDISTKEGREAIRSMAAKLARSKTALDKMGKDLTDAQRKIVNTVNAERSRAWDRMEALQKEIRKPLTEWEDAEKERIATHENTLVEIAGLAHHTHTQAAMIEAIDVLKTKYEGIDWQEFKHRGEAVITETLTNLETTLAARIKADADAAELARLQAEENDRKQKERDAAIAAEAAEKARNEAAQEAERVARQVAEQAAAAAKREADALAAVEREKADRLAAEQRAEQARIAAAEQARKDADAAVEAERQRNAAIQKAESDAAAKREADKVHKSKINNDALVELVKILNTAISPEEQGKAIITAIAKGAVPHVKITY